MVTHLVFHFGPDAPLLTKLGMALLGGYPGCRVTVLERLGLLRDVARREIAEIASWDFERLIMAHGHAIETGGKAALIDAFRWLYRGRALPSPS